MWIRRLFIQQIVNAFCVPSTLGDTGFNEMGRSYIMDLIVRRVKGNKLGILGSGNTMKKIYQVKVRMIYGVQV